MHSIWKVIDEIQGAGELGEGIERVARRSRRNLILMASVVAVVAIAAAVALFGRRDQAIGPNAAGVGAVTVIETASLTVHTEPSNAEIFLGDRRIGRSPIEAASVAAGRTPVRIELLGYHDVVDTLDIVSDSLLERTFALEPVTGRLRVESTPTGARVFHNGADSGRETPVVLDDLPVLETHRIEIRLAGYAAASYRNVTLAGDSTVVITHSFSKLTGQVRVESDPLGATIVVDGREQGRTPEIVTLPYGSHRIELRREGFAPRSGTIEVSQASETIAWPLERLAPGTLVIKITPYADVFIGGEKMKSEATRYETSLAPGHYTLELRHPVFAVVQVPVDIVSGEVTEKVVDLSQGGERQ